MKIGNSKVLVCALVVIGAALLLIPATDLACALKRRKNQNILQHINSTVGSSEKLTRNLQYFDVGYRVDQIRSAKDDGYFGWSKAALQHRVKKGDEVISFLIINPNQDYTDNLSYLMGLCTLRFQVVYRNNKFVFADRTPFTDGM